MEWYKLGFSLNPRAILLYFIDLKPIQLSVYAFYPISGTRSAS
ncbi:protein of unknown function [Shewanella benthica]|uniref:Uncharacterized protein n=1 Tax=Shewanella benthica TaxID=43661 RepID=A0A330LZC7_9GAMM|nr:protein of unknown function [Shewanella benthica]